MKYGKRFEISPAIRKISNFTKYQYNSSINIDQRDTWKVAFNLLHGKRVTTELD